MPIQFDEKIPSAPLPRLHAAPIIEGLPRVSPGADHDWSLGMLGLAKGLGLSPEDRPEACLTLPCPPTPLRQAQLVRVAPSAAALVGMNADELGGSDWANLLAGNALLCEPRVQPYATAYSGHQFGVFVPRLGDGRALHLGCFRGWELQLKGAGPTPFRRGADGRAVLRSSVREFLGSEYMASQQVPTTRALSLVLAPGPIFREQSEPAGVVCRMAPAFWRLGHLEWMVQHGHGDAIDPFLRALLPSSAGHEGSAALRLDLLQSVAAQTGRLMGLWMAEGFIHGVMNTDNLSLLGLTLDYGPYGFLERMQLQQVFNHSDSSGRYRYDHQPLAALWSLMRLANALDLPRGAGLREDDLASWFEAGLDEGFEGRMCLKLGLPHHHSSRGPRAPRALLDRLYRLSARGEWRLPALLRRLALEDLPEPLRTQPEWAEGLRELGPLPEWADEEFAAWRQDHIAARNAQAQGLPDEWARLGACPAVMPWNWILESIIRAAEDNGDLAPLDRALDLWSQPQTRLSGYGDWAGPAPGWAASLELSCSS